MNSPRPANTTTAKAAVVALIFVLISVVLIWKLFGGDDGDGTETVSPSGTDTTLVAPVVTDESGQPVVETTLAPTTTTIPKGNIQVVVANAARVAGSAGRAKDTLVAQGYTVTSATNAVDVLDITAVYYREGMDAAAADVAAVLGAKTDQVALMPIPEPALDAPVTPQVHILVMLGKDLAK